MYIGQQVEVAIIDLFVCGAEPTSSALSWAILCMVAFPDIQRRCHDELDQARSYHSSHLISSHLISCHLISSDLIVDMSP